MALVGPADSLAVGVACYLLSRAAVGLGSFDARLALFYLGQLKLVLGLSNLLTAFPWTAGTSCAPCS